MKYAAKLLATGSAIAMAMTASASAADLSEPRIIETPVYEAPESLPMATSGWYIRGDLGYSWNKYSRAVYITNGTGGTSVLNGKLKSSFAVGAGAGYQINNNFRVDATVDYNFNADFTGSTVGTCNFGGGLVPCTSTDVAKFSALTVLANAYVDLGTYSGFTPYVGAGIGGARIHWGDLSNTECSTAAPGTCNPTVVHTGSKEWRFAYALMAGVSYMATKNIAFDVGYRYKHIEGGRMFAYANGAGPGYDEGITSHEVRAGIRYKFGAPHPAPTPVYQPTPIYK